MRSFLLLAVAMMLAACARPETVVDPTEPPSQEQAQRKELQMTVLDEIHLAIGESFVYPSFGGADWESEVSIVRNAIEIGLTEEEFAQAIEKMLSALPEGSASYMTRAERVEAELQSGTLYEGIGAFVSFRPEPSPRVVLLSVIAGSPAEEAGLRAHDAIYGVDGFPVTEQEGLSIIERVRGPAGTEVMLEVASPGEDHREVMVRRERVNASDTLKGDLVPPGVIYVLVPVAVDDTLPERVAGLLQLSEMEEQPALGLVLDLRIASSGSTWPLTEMLSLLGDGDMGYFASRLGEQPVTVQGTDIANSQAVPLAILIGPDTNGAPEMLAGALQARDRASLIGLPTGGGVMSFRQQVLSDGSQLIYADSSYVTSDGSDLGIRGLIPDVRIESDWDAVTPSLDPVLQGAIDFLLNAQDGD